MQDELKAIQAKVGTTFVHVTHDQEEAMAIADRIVVMNAGRSRMTAPPPWSTSAPAASSARASWEVNRIPLTDGLSPSAP